MPTPVAGPLRLARAALVAVLVLALTAGAHAVAGGHLPDPLVLAALGALTLAGTVLAARARFTAPRLVALLGGAQLALHVALDTLGHGVAVCVAGAASGHAAHGMPLACTAASPVPDAATVLASSAHLGPVAAGAWMVTAHAGATLVLAVVLARGERALERFLAWLTPRQVALATVVVAARRPLVLAAAPARPTSRDAGAAPTRGPPVARLVGAHV